MRCDYFDAGACRSCSWMGRPYADQVRDVEETVRSTLAAVGTHPEWLPTATGPESGFRNKAKLVVGGRAGAVTLGILDGRRRGVDLRACGLHEPGLAAALPLLADHVDRMRVAPYDVPARRGELKYLLVTHTPTGDLMVRFVVRSEAPLRRIREAVPGLQAALPGLRVVSANLHPEHKAVLEGETEVPLTTGPGAEALVMPAGDVDLLLRPRSFFQTNTAVAGALYRQAKGWVDEAGPTTVWDLFCGVGGFALHAAAPGRRVVGVELSEDAVASGEEAVRRLRAADRDPGEVAFVAGDAGDWAAASLAAGTRPDLVVVNPPRRGITGLAGTLESSGVPWVVYSSCNAGSLARDLAAMPSYRCVRGRVFDMFPQTTHAETLVLLRRRG